MKVLFYPDPPVQVRGHTLCKNIRYFKLLGYELTNDIGSNWDIGVYWNYRAGRNRNLIYNEITVPPRRLIEDPRPVLNIRCTDVTKTNVDKIFKAVFKYSSMADTTKFGYCIKKSERQSAHDGQITRLPCKKEKGFIYQKLLDSRSGMHYICDIRMPIFMGKIPLLFMKCRDTKGTFDHTFATKKKYWTPALHEYLSADEIAKIIEFCTLIGLDLGEIEAIRDNSTQKLYIFDVNDTPGSRCFTALDNNAVIEKSLADFFGKLI